MTIKTYFLSEDKTVYLKAYMLDNVEGLPFCEKRPGILILPGGGYEYCSAREGEPVAMHYLAEGYNAFVLIYSCNARHPAPLLNASYAILKLRQRCDEFGIDPNKLAVWGASAGGHLAACTATMWQDPSIYKALGCKPEDIRPDAAILSYPVISGTTTMTAFLRRTVLLWLKRACLIKYPLNCICSTADRTDFRPAIR